MLLQCCHSKDTVSHVSIAASSFITEHRKGPELHGPKKVLFHVTRTLFGTCL